MKTISALLTIIALFPLTVFAGQTVSIGVSCTIPAIPGLNAPILEQRSVHAVGTMLVAGEKGQVKTYYVR